MIQKQENQLQRQVTKVKDMIDLAYASVFEERLKYAIEREQRDETTGAELCEVLGIQRADVIKNHVTLTTLEKMHLYGEEKKKNKKEKMVIKK